MAPNAEPELRGLPILNRTQILEDLGSLTKDGDFERRLLSKASTTEGLAELSPGQAQLPLPSHRPEKPSNISDAVTSAAQLLHLNRQLTQRGSEIEQRKIGDRLEQNRKKIDHLLSALNKSSLLASSQPASPSSKQKK
ncbi:hypothetical protein PCANC_00256 [Puccinia coronata f. sp. avenae]|uniref:Uncharacterized protein n=1 Tax=Puccinia coronata f. sp. avenae TaxID=200324 RepID=A0A2N5W9G0_9BASI|nr:hypothetical protein PCASD_06111 [Puccinia coronata f. sp. avenae]PLW58838.1 hypothetical protein PCANC_00256 [Puccinia coronata f. sp. avenae]